MFRAIMQDLLNWKDQVGRMPLLLRGARQIGKSYIMEKFGETSFRNTVIVNFEFEKKYIACFSTLDPKEIISAISVIANQNITAGDTLLVLDEIQECPDAILALRYFKEKMPQLHVMAAGSLLEFVLNSEEFRMPVGRVQSLYMKPCSFKEYLLASKQNKLSEYIESVTLEKPINEGIHLALLDQLRKFLFLGGMPEVLNHYIQEGDVRFCKTLQASIHEFYRRDFGKYNKQVKLEYLQAIYDKAPKCVGEKFQYRKINPDVQSRDLKPALLALKDAGLIYPLYHTSASGLPLKSTVNERKFKLLFVDVGLMVYESLPNFEKILGEHLILLNRGAIAEQFVGQELLAYQPSYAAPELYFWDREQKGSKSEVDYITHIDNEIVPIEVKAGKTGRLKSLQVFLDEKKIDVGVRISQSQLSFERRVLSIPLYMTSELPRLYRSART